MFKNFTISPVEHPLPPTDIVIIPRGINLGKGFEYAESLLRQGRSVQVVGSGVTLSENWPNWVKTTPNLQLTELANRPLELVPDFLPFRKAIDEWLDIIFADVVPGFRGSRVFYGEAVLRLLSPIIETYAGLANLAKDKKGVRYHCVDEQWSGFESLQNIAERNDGMMETRSQRTSWLWPVAFLLTGCVAFVGTLLDQLRAYVRETPSRAKVRQLRLLKDHGKMPRFWVVLVPDWMRINLHVLESVVKPALQNDESVGVLLTGTLQPGVRMESNMRARTGSEIWPGLGLLQKRIQEFEFDQLISPESTIEFLSVLARTARQSPRVLFRLASRPARISLGAFHFDLARHRWQAAKLATKDVWTAVAAERASIAAIQRHSFAGTKVVLVSACSSSLAVADLILQSAGALTVDFAHGSPVSWLTDTPSVSSLKCVWTLADASPIGILGQQAVVAGLPRTVTKNTRPTGYKATNILITSNYATLDSLIGDSLPFLPYQEQLLAVIRFIRERYGKRFQFRWRPHPADLEWAVRGTLKQYPDVDLSRGRALAVDAAWSDLVITSSSSVVPQLLLAEVPIFLHVRPSLLHAAEVEYFSPERKFFNAQDLIQAFSLCIARLDLGDPSALDPEKDTRIAFFGEIAEPTSLFDTLNDGQFRNSEPTAGPGCDSVADRGN